VLFYCVSLRSVVMSVTISAYKRCYSKHILATMIYFDYDMSKSTNTVVYFDLKTVIYIYVCGKCRAQFMQFYHIFYHDLLLSLC
jgi:hypothetical protein